MSRRVIRLIPSCAAYLCLASILVRITVRDRFQVTGVLFYMFPPVALTVLAAIAAVGWFLAGRRRLAWPAAVAVLVCVLWSLGSQFEFHSQRSAETSYRFLFWNVARCRMGRQDIIERIRAFDADVVGLVEVGEPFPDAERTWQADFLEYRVRQLNGQMLVITKGDILSAEEHELGGGSRCRFVQLLLDGQPLALVLVDLVSNPFGHRQATFAKLENDVLFRHAHEPLVVMGDFNTPSDSVFFSGMRQWMVNAFEAGGNGYSATWPVPVPLIAIDQMWVNAPLTVYGCRHVWTAQSDHRAVVAELGWRAESN